MANTDPLKNVSYIIVFFVLLLVFLVSLGNLAVAAQEGSVTPKNRAKVIIISIFIVLVLMFRSAQSLSWVDGLALLLIIFGFWFYIGRRSA
jgi:amino acid permease